MNSLSAYKPYNQMYVDAMNLVVRSHYGLSMLEHNGHKTGALTGVARLVVDWQKKNPGIKIVFIWEGRNSWRKAKYPIYKAQRVKENRSQDPKLRKEFFRSIDIIKESLPVMGVSQVWAETYEADDTVWTVMLDDIGKKLFVSTDWDWWPLSQYGDILYTDEVMQEDALQKKFASKFNCDIIPMDRMPIFKILTGDPSDNLSGIPRFPKKLAAKIAADKSISLDNLISGIATYGSSTWVNNAKSNQWILDRNTALISADPPNPDVLEWVPSAYNESDFEDVLLKSGMGYLYEKLTGGYK